MIYFIKSEGFVKIGFTEKTVLDRLAALQCGNPVALRLMALMEGSERLEHDLHKKFSEYHVRLEWFLLSDEISKFIDENAIRRYDFHKWRHLQWLDKHLKKYESRQ